MENKILIILLSGMGVAFMWVLNKWNNIFKEKALLEQKYQNEKLDDQQKLLEHLDKEAQKTRDFFTETKTAISSLSSKLDGLATREHVENVRNSIDIEMKSYKQLCDEKINRAEALFNNATSELRACKTRIEGFFKEHLERTK